MSGPIVDEHARALARRRGYEKTVRRLLGPEPINTAADETIAGGRTAPRDPLARHPAIDAVFFVADVLAVGGSLEAAARGIAVPCGSTRSASV